MIKRNRKKKSVFSGKVAKNLKHTSQQNRSYGYINLPDNTSMFTPEPGNKELFDIIPYIVTDKNHPDRNDEEKTALPGDQWWKRPFKIHRDIGSEKDTVVCPTSFGKKCPICKYRMEQIKNGADKEETDQLKTKERNLYIVIPKNNKKYDEKIHIMDISHHLFQKLLTLETEEDESFEIFPDIEQGYTLSVRFDSKTMGEGKPFPVASRIDFRERDEPYDESILKESPNLDKLLQVMSYDKLEAKFFEIDNEENEKIPEIIEDEENEEDEEDEEELPKRTRKKPISRLKKKKTKDAEEDDDVEDDDQDDDVEDDDQDDDDDQDVDQEEDEDDIPFDQCKACEGTGKNSKGKTCRICKGTGETQEEEKTKTKTKTKTKNKCPYGYVFGKDTDEYPECDDCDIWSACFDAKEGQ